MPNRVKEYGEMAGFIPVRNDNGKGPSCPIFFSSQFFYLMKTIQQIQYKEDVGNTDKDKAGDHVLIGFTFLYLSTK